MLAEIKVAPLLIQALFGELFFIMFSVLTRWLREWTKVKVFLKFYSLIEFKYLACNRAVIIHSRLKINWNSTERTRTGTTWYRDISRLPLKPPQSFKPKNVTKTGFFVFLWIWPKPMRGSQREENFQKTSLKAQKNSSRFNRHLFLFFQTCFQFSLTVLLFLPHVCFI